MRCLSDEEFDYIIDNIYLQKDFYEDWQEIIQAVVAHLLGYVEFK